MPVLSCFPLAVRELLEIRAVYLKLMKTVGKVRCCNSTRQSWVPELTSHSWRLPWHSPSRGLAQLTGNWCQTKEPKGVGLSKRVEQLALCGCWKGRWCFPKLCPCLFSWWDWCSERSKPGFRDGMCALGTGWTLGLFHLWLLCFTAELSLKFSGGKCSI